jgi:hypothetical protein
MREANGSLTIPLLFGYHLLVTRLVTATFIPLEPFNLFRKKTAITIAAVT